MQLRGYLDTAVDPRVFGFCLLCHAALRRPRLKLPKLSAKTFVDVTMCQHYPSALEGLTAISWCERTRRFLEVLYQCCRDFKRKDLPVPPGLMMKKQCPGHVEDWMCRNRPDSIATTPGGPVLHAFRTLFLLLQGLEV
jgi:hypothetical protein